MGMYLILEICLLQPLEGVGFGVHCVISEDAILLRVFV